MTVGLEFSEAVLVIETSGNIVRSLSHSLMFLMAFNGHEVAARNHNH